jgi:hypothetical protein
MKIRERLAQAQQEFSDCVADDGGNQKAETLATILWLDREIDKAREQETAALIELADSLQQLEHGTN